MALLVSRFALPVGRVIKRTCTTATNLGSPTFKTEFLLIVTQAVGKSSESSISCQPLFDIEGKVEMKVHLVNSIVLCLSLVGSARILFADELPDSVQNLIEQNARAASKIIESSYHIEHQSTHYHITDELLSERESRISAPGEVTTKTSRVYRVADQTIVDRPEKILRSEVISTHLDLQTRIFRSSVGREMGGLVSDDDCSDPCTCRYMGNMKLDTGEHVFHPLHGFSVLFISRTVKSLTLFELVAESKNTVYFGREQFEGHWCEVFSVDQQKFWVDENRNGIVRCMEYPDNGRPTSRAVFSREFEALPGHFIPGTRRQFKLTYDEQTGEQNAQLEYERELLKLSFNPEEWPNAMEKDFGFRFMPNSIVQDLTVPTRPLYAIGDSINDVQFTFHRTDEFIRWCDERTGKDPTTSAPLPNEEASSEAGVSTYSLVGIGLVIIGLVVAAMFCFPSLWRKGKR